MNIDQLIEDLKDRDLSIRIYAARALRWFSDEKALRPLIQALRDDSEGVRFQALKSLKKLTNQDIGIEPDKWEAWLAQRRA